MRKNYRKRLERDELGLAALALVAAVVVVIIVGPVGLVLFPIVIADVAALVWGRPADQPEEGTMSHLKSVQDESRGRPRRLRTSQEVLAGARSGDPRALRELINERSDSVIRMCAYALHGTPHDPLDLAQEAWIKIIQSLSTVRDSDSMSSWIARTTFNTCKDFLRSPAAREAWVPLSEHPAAGDPILGLLEVISVESWLNTLDPEDVAIIRLHRGMGLALEDVAVWMNDLHPRRKPWTRKECGRSYRRLLAAAPIAIATSK